MGNRKRKKEREKEKKKSGERKISGRKGEKKGRGRE